MKKVNPKVFSKSRTDLAGDILCNSQSSEEEKDEALEILSNWRGAHSYPLHVFKQRLKNVSEKIDPSALSAQRLKRVPSIIKKLNREYSDKKATMKLTQMQDIAGCRAVVSDVSLAKKLYLGHYIKGDIKHKRVNEKDYITNPKKDGYRSIHLIYRYHSDKKGRINFNGLLIEVQIRSKLQHIWATAIETVDFFTRQAIKSNQDEEDLYKMIKQKEMELQVRIKMNRWAKSLKLFDNLKNKKNFHFFLLELDTIQEKLTISAYSKRQEQKAIFDYAAAEKKIYGRGEYDVVLVGADTVKDLKKAYPNYFLDTKKILINLNKVLNKN